MLNQYQQKLYDDLMNLVAIGNDAFYYKDHSRDWRTYRVFNYRLASYTEFCLPSALECRGVMFELDMMTQEPIRLACMMPEKFFNLNENPFTMNLELSKDTIEEVMIKEDGSIISTYLHDSALAFKSKTSISSEHAKFAENWVTQPQNIELFGALLKVTQAGFAVHMELVTPVPDLKIVVTYPKTDLVIHSIRSNADGSYLSKNQLGELFGACGYLLESKWVATVDVQDVDAFIAEYPSHTDLEGYIIKLKTGQKIKIKTDWYNARHHAKFGITCMRQLYEYLLDEQLDDIKAILFDDIHMLNIIANLEAAVVPLYNGLIKECEMFFNENRHLDRKSYAIKAQEEMNGKLSLLMNLYLGKEPDYKLFAKKNPSLFGVNPQESLGSLCTLETE